MIAHIYRNGESDTEGLHPSTNRITMFNDGERFSFPNDKVLVLGTAQRDMMVIPMSTIRWYWVEED